ncbi:hypothetical protein TeGR_g4469, partial [Tetraparma gracilis]
MSSSPPPAAAFLAGLLGAAIGTVGVLALLPHLSPSSSSSPPPSSSSSAGGADERGADERSYYPQPSPGSPLRRGTLQRKMSGDADADPSALDASAFSSVPARERSPSNVSRSGPDPAPLLDMHSSNGLTPLTQTLRDISARPAGAPILVVGIAGGSGSGKTTLAQAIYAALGRDENVTFLSHDSYYKDLSSWTMEQRSQQNFDHPNSLDTDLMVRHLSQLRAGECAEIPNYDFSTHARTAEVTLVQPRQVILVEGILIFTEPALAGLIDVKIFVDTESDIRLIRRVTRDCQERGRSLEQVLEQYTRT